MVWWKNKGENMHNKGKPNWPTEKFVKKQHSRRGKKCLGKGGRQILVKVVDRKNMSTG